MNHSPGELFAILDDWVADGCLRAIDLALARLVHERATESDPAVLLAVALCSAGNARGHVCLDLDACLPPSPAAEEAPEVAAAEALLTGSGLTAWRERLAASAAIACAVGDDLKPDGTNRPLVLGGTPERPLLYLRRYWDCEARIRRAVAARLALPPELQPDPERVGDWLERLFGSAADPADDPWPRAACALAARSAFGVITGGPGTGKTTTVVRLLALLQGLRLEAGAPPLRIQLAAPTGKAASRLNESIAARVANLPLAGSAHGEQVRAAIPTLVTTLHRLLGSRPDSRHFHHHARHPLVADLVVVDEASMVDIELLASLLAALRPAARLILIGDKDQLASVEAGAVLGDLCARAAGGHYQPATLDWLQRALGAPLPEGYADPAGRALDQSVAMLRRSHRFSADGGIGALAALVNRDSTADDGGVARCQAVLDLCAVDGEQIAAIKLAGTEDRAFEDLIATGHADYLELLADQDPGDTADQAAFDALANAALNACRAFQLLTPLRRGPWGVDGLNRHILTVLAAPLAKLRQADNTVALPAASHGVGQAGRWFPGRPVLVTGNDYALGLMNGDIGLCLALPGEDGCRRLRVAFARDDGSGAIRWVLPSRLAAVETAFALTVHKSQGSEFLHTALVLPPQPSPVLTRELLYTAITRASGRFTLLYSDPAVLAAALQRRVRRASGLVFD